MLQFSGNTRWERFLEAVNSLDAKFRNKEIISKTGYSKGIVSEYLNPDSGKEPSENFLRTFCEKFGFNFNDIWLGQSGPLETGVASATDQTLLILARLMEGQKIILEDIRNNMARQESQATIADKVKGIESNLTRVLVGVETLSGDYETGIAEMRGFFAQSTGNKKRPSRGGGKKSGRIDGAGKKRGSNP